MKMSLKWINEFVDIHEFFSEPEKLGEVLTHAGLEVEEIVNRVKDYNQVVVGIVLEKEVHPNADKLSLCRVSVGPNEIHQIICGAQNHKKGDRVVVALPGAVLPGNFAIQKAKIRSIESHGMLCSEKELALAKESEGILILPPEAPIGESFAKYYGLDDVIFDLKVTPNRADGLSHLGLAREISCLLARSLKIPTSSLKLSAGKTSDKIQVRLNEPKSCLRYTGRYIKNITVQESPLWLKKRLESLGMNSINNIVDVTNYVLMEMGQPLHAFDADLISGHSLNIENVKKDETFITLDGSELHFSGTELGIRDQERTLVLAGVIGGKNSGVSIDTKNIFLECAYFSPDVIRKTSRSFGIETDSSYRFSRGVDPNLIPQVLDRATELILSITEGDALAEIIDLYPEPVVKKSIIISLNTISDRLGYPVDSNSFESFMKGLGCEVIKTKSFEYPETMSFEYQILPPSFRVDLEFEMDLVEEYARLKGYEHIPETLPSMKEAPKFQDKNFQLIQSFSENWVQWGYQEAINFVFLSEKKENEILGDRKNLASFGLDIPG
ncbi:MAG TPA: phenylalanine--tRNA ligase subunit beta, partial [Pseudobdellovibrionaceae bacterium]|nr:phenylalanine--tRNA ligase subunit beta [Pseudobdellovibrionaceae bacterium]